MQFNGFIKPISDFAMNIITMTNRKLFHANGSTQFGSFPPYTQAVNANDPTNRAQLLQARAAVPFLADIPDDIYFNLDHRELCIPQGIVADARRRLEESLGEYVMTYRRGVFLKNVLIERHLCARLAGADLDAAKQTLLNEYEDRFREAGVSFVVYKKPVTVIPVEESYIFKHLHGDARAMHDGADEGVV